ncbi:HDOD domain-containing protein [Dissulfurirhabdus thermomarina]|uniref:HDOD domain-containing protein n=1 Tax=Dissulfurirhabdus thermomarina TaxID=1765737 RepID=A0A6N9TMC8_DISTH|nr:HDOD domain-containing protein [Dissulfurirhabdus thermomarina]NDY42198.1 HDOD domain-containing protein [Dissulfurirhabdus thermomarina]NMX22674.1 HDOD domain-containing protein [Dissulfurirhabdus thermomarina]
MTVSEERVQAIRHRLKEVQSLPTLPPIVSKLNRMVEDEEVTAEQLGRVIEKDQVLTSKLLKMVNSSFFGFPQRISTVSNAIVLLGFNVIKTLIVTSSIFEVMQESDVGLWEHSLGCATAAGILARRRGVKNPEEISTAGLIHDLGKIVVRSELPEDYARVQDLVAARQVAMREAELEVLGVGHGEIGGWLARQWNLPDRLVRPIEAHHHPETAGEFRELAAIVHFADILVRAVGFGFGGDPWVPPLDHEAWERIKFGRSVAREILAELDDKLLELQDFTMEIQRIGED